MSKLNIVSMANDIGRMHPFTMRRAFEAFYNSIARYNQNFTINFYTNLPKHWFARDKVRVLDSSTYYFLNLYPGNRWYNSSFNRFFILEKHLKLGDNPIWLDLDTIICGNIEHFADYPNLFIKYGFGENLVTLNSRYARAQKEWIHGHVFKIDQTIVNWIKEILAKGEDIPTYEMMSFLTLLDMQHPGHFYILNELTDKLVNSQWCYDPKRPSMKINSLTNQHFHEEPRFIKNRIKLINGRPFGYDSPPESGGKLREFLILTFTFFQLEANLRQNWRSIADPDAREWLRSFCRITPFDQLKLDLIYLCSLFTKDKIKKIPGVKLARQILKEFFGHREG